MGTNTAEAEVPRKDADGAPSIPPQAVGAAVSKLILATFGEFAVIYSHSLAHKHLAATHFKDSNVKMLMRDPATWNARVVPLQEAGEIVSLSAGSVNMEQAPQPLRRLATSNASLRHTESADQAPRHRLGKRAHGARVVIAPRRNIDPQGIERARRRLRPLNDRRHDAR
jgi:hypothetical protein